MYYGVVGRNQKESKEVEAPNAKIGLRLGPISGEVGIVTRQG